ncbi:protoporphyrinogen oxidase [Ichthyobacterium seriolicida]|uniref:Coproporphyrinogen III oxidase n=1 Tax=Ichthyobacterium seriolicida TaxID=242600 RepID=A0A1J1DZ62_9FLAO|nr:protoporphyrinogen oxidase [Ichthyobacterium seriolicida]BAV95202.1 protoporphyrinogen oxidase [Ichthyobacterium seriolicida]
MDNNILDSVIVGSGISGLTLAHELHKRDKKFIIIDEIKDVGGMLQTQEIQGFPIDNSAVSASMNKELLQLIRELNLEDKVLYANSTAKKRYILRSGKLHDINFSIPGILKSSLLSLSSKIRIFKEIFIKPFNGNYDESVAQFVSRRFGKEFLDYVVNPMVAGIFSGDPKKMSLKSSFSKIYDLERIYGSIIKGLNKIAKQQSPLNRNIFSFKGGLSALTKAISDQFPPEIVQTSTRLESVEKQKDNFILTVVKNDKRKVITTKSLLLTIPSHRISRIIKWLDLSKIDDIYYSPINILTLCYNRVDIKHPLDAFGFLVPEKEKMSFLGAIWNTSIFTDKYPKDKVLFTIFIGRARNADKLANNKKQVIEDAKLEFEKIMCIERNKEVFTRVNLIEKSIPQYGIGHSNIIDYIGEIEKNNRGLYFSGNYISGISIGDCVKYNVELSAEKLA